MQYRINPQNGDSISALAYGCMRLQRDEKVSARQVAYAIDNGVNYFDTAYIYPNNEVLLGKILPTGSRQAIHIATKLPPYLVKKPGDMDRLFETQLKRLQTDYIDYYLIHMLPNRNEWQRLQQFGIERWIENKKQAGQIRNIGFSFHGGLVDFKDVIDAYPWEFCMIQYNYLDENSQAGKPGLVYAASKGMPVMVMEPLRGGRLVNLPVAAKNVFEQAEEGRSPAEWGLRWVWNHGEVLTALSGMNSMEMVKENIRIASEVTANTLQDHELSLYSEVVSILNDQIRVPCTGCGYCMPCPSGVDIPLCFSQYNEVAAYGPFRARMNYILRNYGHQAALCTACGKCETHCPQSIAIREKLKEVSKYMESFPFKPMHSLIRTFMHQK